jgi:hypothetical protein
MVMISGTVLAQQTPTDPVARLQEKLERGEVKLEYNGKNGYLASILKALDIPVSSQTLVFSKTSLQLDRIGPWAPRALYFNDDVYVGAVLDGPILELASVDPGTGGVFYTVSQKPDAPPEFERQGTTCLLCHNSSSTAGVPGFLVRSIYPDRHGSAIASVGQDIATDQTPLKERWGGWYMSGTHSEPQSLGNWKSTMLTNEISSVRTYLSRLNIGNENAPTDLKARFNVDSYLSPYSDVVALMVLTHQVNLHNLIAATNQRARKAGYHGSVSENDTESVNSVGKAVEPLVRAMFFVNEAPLSGPMKGASGFTTDFENRGPHDRKNRSLRDFDLSRRMFRYPLSYLVYSDGFNALPEAARKYAYRRFREILTGEDQRPEFAHLSVSDRQAILEILTETKPDFAGFMTDFGK